MKDSEIVVMVIAIGLLFVILAFVFFAKADCQDSGGKFVRGVVWYECVRSK